MGKGWGKERKGIQVHEEWKGMRGEGKQREER